MDLKKVQKSKRKKNGAVDGKKVDQVWTTQAKEAFERLKKAISSDTFLALPHLD
jgi:hypothetical protein